jgi:paraquat-inducible protein B
VQVGEALGYQISDRTSVVTGEVFVKAPYDKRVRTGSVWWEASGISTAWEPTGLRLQIPSVQAALSGGLAFNVPQGAPDYPLAAPGTVFPLFSDQPAAERASNRARLIYSVVFTSSAPGLAPGSPVLLFGRQVGEVTRIRLEAQLGTGEAVVRVILNVLPGALTMIGEVPAVDDADLAPRLVAGGMRAAVVTTSYVTGAQAVSLEFGDRPTTAPTMNDGIVVLPAVETNGMASMLSSVSGFLTSVKAMPLQSMGNAVNNTLLSLISSLTHSTIGKQAQSATMMLRNVGAAVRRTDASLAPLLSSLPPTIDGLRRQLSQANQSLAAADRSYGPDSTWQASLARKIANYYDTARYVRLLADYLSRHPEAIARGSSSQGAER